MTDDLPTDTSPEPAEKAGAAESAKKAKSERTRALILETAMRLFQERGYEKTTMRAIAAEAGVSVGNAYYYYEGKEFLIQGFYDRMTHEHLVEARQRMAGERDFSERLCIALDSWVDCAAPYHEFAAQFFRTAADPNSALSPFSNESHPARETAVQLFREVLDGSDLGPKIDPELDELLPDLLWLHLMVVVLYWVFDRTDDTERTRAFVKRCSPFVAKLVTLSRYRVFRPLVRDAVDMIKDFVLPTIGKTTASRPTGATARSDATESPAAEAETVETAETAGKTRTAGKTQKTDKTDQPKKTVRRLRRG
ncbi:TetR/AcrR family transcriptional regulator [Streptacidiphilus rugosus]|uniref:TetR/AcrR family transcriptional regulator n=1 Tax=Streptacidiphilus rugosus TaxID=405783 RepID=UPI000A56B3CC|nr:TetR family transcriptional regulator [Streptacidiphilus rugosus]